MNPFDDDSLDDLLRSPLTHETFEQLLQIFEDMQRANLEHVGGTPFLYLENHGRTT
jgi:hypothetical protein